MNHNIVLRRTIAGTLTLVVPVIRYGREPYGHYGPGVDWYLEQSGGHIEAHAELLELIDCELTARGLDAFGLLELLVEQVDDPMARKQLEAWRAA